MGRGVAGDFVTGIEGADFLRKNPVAAVEETAVQMEGAFDSVLIKDFDQAAVLGATVVVAHGERFMLSAGKAAVDSVHGGNSCLML